MQAFGPRGDKVSRKSIALLTAVLIGTGSVTVASAAITNSPWRQTDWDGSHSRFNPAETALTPSTVTGAKYRRSIAVPPIQYEGYECQATYGVSTAPVAVDQRVFTVVSGYLYSYDVYTGRQLWRTEVDRTLTEIPRGLAVRDGRVLLGTLDCTSESDPTGTVFAFDSRTGAPLWTSGVQGTVLSMVLVGTHIVVAGYSAGNGAAVSMIDAASGATEWVRTVDFDACAARPELALVVRNQVLVNECDDSSTSVIRAVALEGHVVWTRAGLGQLEAGDSSSRYGTDVLARTTDGQLTSLLATTGATRWTTATPGRVLAVDPARVFLRCDAETICALSRATGDLIWQRQSPIWGRTNDVAPVAAAGGLFYLGTGEVLRASDGTLLHRLWFNQARYISVANGRVLAVPGAPNPNLDGPRVIDIYGLAGS
jgi:hypothetical protein